MVTFSGMSHRRTVPSSAADRKTSLEGCVPSPHMGPSMWPFTRMLHAAFFSPTSMISAFLVPTRIFPLRNQPVKYFKQPEPNISLRMNCRLNFTWNLQCRAWRTFPLQTERTQSMIWPVSRRKARQRFNSWSQSFRAPPSLDLQINGQSRCRNAIIGIPAWGQQWNVTLTVFPCPPWRWGRPSVWCTW